MTVAPGGLTSASVDGGGAEGLPDDGLTDVGGDEKRDTRTQTVAFLEQLVQKQNNQTCHKQLQKPGRLQLNYWLWDWTPNMKVTPSPQIAYLFEYKFKFTRYIIHMHDMKEHFRPHFQKTMY